MSSVGAKFLVTREFGESLTTTLHIAKLETSKGKLGTNTWNPGIHERKRVNQRTPSLTLGVCKAHKEKVGLS